MLSKLNIIQDDNMKIKKDFLEDAEKEKKNQKILIKNLLDRLKNENT